MPAGAFADAAADSTGIVEAGMVRPAVLDHSGAVIGNISIRAGSVFDLDNPEENGLLYRMANRLHFETREDVIRQQLLFEPGDTFSSRELLESERILRSNRYIHDATIQPVSLNDGVVDVSVETQDVWTLVPHVSASRAGGKNSAGIGLKEMNLLGTGIEVEALYKSDVDRDGMAFRFANHNIGDSWYGVSGTYGVTSDGHVSLFEFGKPFYALDTTSANGIKLADKDQIDYLYDSGDLGASYRHQARQYEIHKGWSKGLQDGWVKRFNVGLGYDEHLFSDVDFGDGFLTTTPEDRRLVYPYVEMELLQDRFEKTTNLDQISETEDHFLGSRLSARLGYAGQAFGSDRNAWLVGVNADTGFGDAGKQILLLGSGLSTRFERGAAANLVFDFDARYYRRQSERRVLYASLSGSVGHALDIDNAVQLGGDTGLRGYPLRYQGGDKFALLTVEQRYFTDWYPFHLFHVGGAVFMDVGRAWGNTGVNFRDEGVLRDVGLGLRISNSRSAIARMTHVDIAFPLDGGSDIHDLQFVIQTKKGF
jgi:hypothetical protein